MKLLLLSLILLSIFHSANGAFSIVDFITRWNAATEEEKCQSCVNVVYGLLLNSNMTQAEQYREIVVESHFCPWLSEVLYNDRTVLDIPQCTSFVTSGFNAFFPLYYYPNYFFRTWYCVPICGNSGEQYVN